MSSIFFDAIRRLSQARLNEITIDQKRCIDLRYKEERLCTACQENCTVDAVEIDDLVKIDWGRCIQCGVCAAVCPTEVFTIQIPSDNMILKEIAGQLANRRVRIECDFVNSRFKGEEKHRPAKADKITVPCVGRFSETFLLQSTLAGGDRLEFADCTADCRFTTGRSVVEEMGRRAHRLLGSFGAAARKDTAPEEGKASERRELLQEAGLQAIGILLSRNTPSARGLGTEDRMPPHRAALIELSKRYTAALGLVERGKMPFGNITVDAEKCRLHGVCAEVCPTQALSLSDGNRGKELRFLYGACVGCEACLHACPEGAVKIDETIDLSRLAVTWRTLTGRLYRLCTGCGRQFAVKTGSDSQICPSCVKRWAEIERYAGETAG